MSGGISTQALLQQLLIGLINGSFYALLSLGLAIIFGLLGVINFAHGALYMLGAFVGWGLLHYAGIGYWGALVLAPLAVGLVGVVIERGLLRRLYRLDPLYNLLLTFGIALILQGLFQLKFGSSGEPYAIPEALRGAKDLGFMVLPLYRGWVMVVSLAVCLATWFVIERTKLGSYLRAATENPGLVQAFGVNVPRMITVTYGFGVALAGLAGVLAAPIYRVSPAMGADLIIVVFAVVVIGGMGSIMGSIVTGFALGLLEGLTKVFYPAASNTVVFALMALVLLVRPAGLFGEGAMTARRWHHEHTVMAAMFGLLLVAPFVTYPVLIMKGMCLALFACAFNLLIGYVGLLSFGHAMFLGGAGYAAAHAAKVWALPPELCVLLGTAVAAAMGTVAGWLAIRRQGIYFAMITLGLAQMVYFLCLKAGFTHGEDGIQGVPRGVLLGVIDLNGTTAMYGFVLVVCLLGFALVHRVIHSPFGAVLTAIRENEPRAISLGYRTDHYKLIAFVLSAALAGTAGATKALVFQLASLTDVHWSMSGEVVLMTLIGGLGRYTGPVVGAFVVVALEKLFAGAGGWVTVAQGTVFVICVLAFREGIMGKLAAALRRPL